MTTESIHIRLPKKIMDRVREIADKKGSTPATIIKQTVCEQLN